MSANGVTDPEAAPDGGKAAEHNGKTTMEGGHGNHSRVRDAAMVSIVGCGPGRRSLITPEALEAVLTASALFGSQRLLALFPEFTGPKTVLRGNYTEVLDHIEREPGAAVLVSGDPGFHSFAASVVERVGRARCSIHQGISCVQYAFGRIGLPWEDALLLSAHGERIRGFARRVRRSHKTMILTGSGGVAKVLKQIPASAFAGRRLFVLENLASPGERITELAYRDALSREFSSLAVIVLVDHERMPYDA